MAAATSTTTTADGVRIEHATTGSGADLVLVHGLTDSSLTWGPITPMLAEHYRVTTLDLRGMGRSGDGDDRNALAMVRDLTAVVEAASISDPLVIGHSLGGVVATAYGASASVRGVINVDQPLRLSAFQEGLLQVAPLLRDPASFPSIITAIFAAMDGDQLTAEQFAAIESHRRQRQEVVLGVWNEVIDLPTADLDALATTLTTGLDAPYLSLQFGDFGDDYDSWLHQLLPQAVIETWSSATGEIGHYGHLVDPDRFVQRVLAFDQ
ncbi:MAG: alpha/beta hydrolase fold [Ilumatobacteraceae bacterium]|nr:alpha/beta hydrolase fold [Ilumatobacteraceae bacterium]